MFLSLFSPVLLLAIHAAFSSLVSADVPPFNNSQEYHDGAYGWYPRQQYLSDTNLHGPVANILTSTPELVSPSNYVLWAPGGSGAPWAPPTILDAKTMSVVWQGPSLGIETVGATVQTCNATEYITWWTGKGMKHYKAGRFYLYNSQYELAYTFNSAGDLEDADAHEFFLTPTCTAVITSYQPRSYDLTHYNITDGYIIDSYFQEIDIATGELLFQWQASAHVNVTDGQQPPAIFNAGHNEKNGFDYFHINSVEKDHLGNYLVSARHTWSIYYISGVTGNIIWTLGGPRNDFRDLSDGEATNFAWQHHARWLDANLTKLSLFDDRSTQWQTTPQNLTRGLILSLDYAAHTVQVDKSYPATQGIECIREGSMQVLTDSPEPGNVILGYGQEPAWTEYAPNGTVVFDVTFGPLGHDRWTVDNYRALKVNWTGAPVTSPHIVTGPRPEYAFNNRTAHFYIPTVDANGTALANDTAYFSWNGATELSYWVLLASNSTGNLTVRDNFFAQVPRTGFEEHVAVGAETRFLRAVAVDATHAVIGATSVLDTRNGSAMADAPAVYETFDAAAATQQWKSRLGKSGGLLASLTAKLETVRKQTAGKGPVIAGVVAGICCLALLAVFIVPLVLRWRRRGAYMAAKTFDAGEGLDMEKAGPRSSVSGVGAEDFDDAAGYFDVDSDEDEGDVSRLSSGASTLCGSHEEKADKA